ncbi:hypothetical protein C8J57DRAFT_1663878 [Mycena rebaudengoi]|nr:hypothetical protein C8J57DRAFT_1663878 [Mycena rebaudengoi]
MLLKFTSQDMFNTTLVDVSTGVPVFHLATAVMPGPSSSKGPCRVPRHITVLDESVGGLIELFGTETVQFIPKELTIPTRFDTEYLWTATPSSLYLLDYDSDERRAQLHLHAPTSQPTHVCARSAGFLELAPHPHGLAPPVEILVSLLLLDILRRGRFGLPAYEFAPPSRLQRVLTRLRRNTV